MDGQVHARDGQEEAQAAVDPGYLVVFSRDPVDDALAASIVDRLRAVPDAGWFDDPGAATAAERTTGGYVRVRDPAEPAARALIATARALSADHGIVVEVQWREEVFAHVERGAWRSSSASTGPS